jgi:type I restriction-modification system DNA methylase subunit
VFLLIKGALRVCKEVDSKMKRLSEWSHETLDKKLLEKCRDIVAGIEPTEGVHPGKHTAVQAFLDKNWIKTGKLSKETGRLYNTLFDRREKGDCGDYFRFNAEDVPGFCKSATLNKIKEHGYVLTPGRYVGAAEVEDDGIPFEEKMAELSATLYEQFAQADQLEATIRKNLAVLGYGG